MIQVVQGVKAVIKRIDENIIDIVWDLYAEAVRRYRDAFLLIERDANIPTVGELLKELAQAKAIYQRVMSEKIHDCVA